MDFNETKPVYPIGIAAELIKVCVATLRIWEKKGLIKPARKGKDRYYSKCDIEILVKIKDLINKERLNIEGVRLALKVQPCWVIKNCDMSVRKKCAAYLAFKRG